MARSDRGNRNATSIIVVKVYSKKKFLSLHSQNDNPSIKPYLEGAKRHSQGLKIVHSFETFCFTTRFRDQNTFRKERVNKYAVH